MKMFFKTSGKILCKVSQKMQYLVVSFSIKKYRIAYNLFLEHHSSLGNVAYIFVNGFRPSAIEMLGII